MRDKDTIYRQAAIDTIMEEPSEARYPVYYAEKIKRLSSTQIVAKQILWMETKEQPGFRSYTPHCKCSNCGHELILENINYCYMCGARFVGKEKKNDFQE